MNVCRGRGAGRECDTDHDRMHMPTPQRETVEPRGTLVPEPAEPGGGRQIRNEQAPRKH